MACLALNDAAKLSRIFSIAIGVRSADFGVAVFRENSLRFHEVIFAVAFDPILALVALIQGPDLPRMIRGVEHVPAFTALFFRTAQEVCHVRTDDLVVAGSSDLAVCTLIAILLLLGVRFIANTRIAVVEKRWSPQGSLKGGLIALNSEAGFLPDVLRGGCH